MIIIYEFIKKYDIHSVITNFCISLEGARPIFSNTIKLKKSINPLFTLNNKEYIVLTLHRPNNVDEKILLKI